MTYIPIVAYNNRMIIIDNMDTFAHYYCYVKKQKHGQVTIAPKRDIIESKVKPMLPLDIDNTAVIVADLDPIAAEDDY